MKKGVAALVLLLSAAAGSQALAQQVQEGSWLVRVRAAHLDPANKSDPVGGVGASDRLTVESRTIPEIDISYFFTPNWAAELVLTYPQKHRVYLDGADIGSFKHLPPTLTVQYHFAPEKTWSPYVGAGINYTRISSVNLLGGNADLESSSIGPALQAGIDYKLNNKWSLNLDVKKIYIRSDVNMAAGTISQVKVDPLLIGVGIGYRF
ncbi:OmpW/AlkL family protein [Oxalicibacterium faecigallinarum]|uniref:Putative outer-membrane protein y4mB n=1 Tax=Oxalicibacterium faecigallinarum TaxID=573741 RepID=A0A8J3AQ82_9BURK|nr:OmpW family outer membrane protein [Oxalicibacterium faecigallinarum]GGI17804.1 putative outer-membrane protein y4mB [Oxalicibacterium faecigallinarum]